MMIDTEVGLEKWMSYCLECAIEGSRQERDPGDKVITNTISTSYTRKIESSSKNYREKTLSGANLESSMTRVPTSARIRTLKGKGMPSQYWKSARIPQEHHKDQRRILG